VENKDINAHMQFHYVISTIRRYGMKRSNHKCSDCCCQHGISFNDECTACFTESEILLDTDYPEGAKEYTDV
jgi:hypothetical protein